MADPVTSALVKDLVGKLTSAAIQEYGLLRGLKNDLSALENTFKLIQGVLHDAEMKQTTQKDVEEWLRTLKFASLEAENVLDEAKTEAMIQRVQSIKHKLRTFFSTHHNPLVVRTRIAHKVKNIRKELDVIDAQRSKFKLTPNNVSEVGAGIVGDIYNRETSSLVNLSKIYGRDEEKKMIVDKICNQEKGIRHDDVDDVRVYAIWGMGGIGKTTLAQYVYNHEMVKMCFELTFWVYVSDVFDVKQIIKQIIKAICGPEDLKLDEMSLNDLQKQLQNNLRGKKYFIIMDDVWIESKDIEKWDELCKALICGAKGSTVMVTTRKEDTAQLMAKFPELQHNVAVLSPEESWSLFKMLAFPGGREGENIRELELVGRLIIEKCKGLPLAVKTLGEEMSKDLLIELWMANGFIPSQGDASLYELGEEIFTCLIRRSFFHDVVKEDIDTGETCKMHDLMHDLAQYVMRHDCAVIESGKELITPDEVLHLSLSCKDFEFSKQDLRKLRSLRSMLVFDKFYPSNIRQISNHVYLRVLYLNRIESSTLPESICKLIHLRYLKISDSEIEVLPESIIYLQNLQTLILERCRELCELPKGLRYMRNLQCLDTSSSSHKLQHMPVGIKELTNLRRLSQFAVGRDKGARIGELGNMNLVGMRKLRLSGLENVGGLRDAESANLKDKIILKSLILHWLPDRSEETNDSEVVEGLEPNSGLQELTIAFYMGRVLSPSWLFKLVNLTSILFYLLDKCEQLPPLGKLPSLKRIQLYDMRSLKCLHDDDNGTSKDEILFPSLQELDIHACGSLVSLPNNFPKLQSLNIKRCNKLGSLPDEIQSFKDLNQITIHWCEILSRRCEKGIGEDWPKISHIPYLDIHAPPG
ncbi:NB-ARC domains-containing protein [Artemisia annua]|uniref:NB-ARC domains-containing protein n=1 Tax=Artemisia annua TaxID=35608 RepID=A0A2U1NDC4_ARTAN|nr:NB-ARC domains-containing protein [Artemisia annua]